MNWGGVDRVSLTGLFVMNRLTKGQNPRKVAL